MDDQQLKKQFNAEEKELEEIARKVKTIMLDKNLKKKDFTIEWKVASNGKKLAYNKEQFIKQLYSLMKEYGIFIINARRLTDNNSQRNGQQGENSEPNQLI